MAMINPFAMFLYLEPVMKELSSGSFRKVLVKATAISFFIFVIFLATGTLIFKDIFQIHFEAFRIFGGIIIFSFAYLYIVKGQKAMIQLREDLDDLASDIALPFMVGAGTISLIVLMSFEMQFSLGVLAIAIVLMANFGIIISLKYLKESLHNDTKAKTKMLKIAFDKNLGILLRLNGFFLGAIGINMIIAGINNLYF